MHKKIKLLIELQECDLKINNIQQRKKQIPNKIELISKKINKVKEELENDLANLNALKKEKREIEMKIDDMEEKIRKSNEKLSSIKTNKEYRAALKEIDELEEQKSQLEDRLLEILESIETAEQKHKLMQEKVKQEEKEFEKEKEKILAEEKVLDFEIEKLKTHRQELCEKINKIDKTLLQKYDFLRSRKGGIAISPVIKGVCQTCHLGIPPQKFNELIKGDSLMTCPHCMRIIYWGDDERYQDQNQDKEAKEAQ